MNQVADSEELQARIGEEIDANSLIALGAEHGCEFTAEDLQESGELSDEELDGVAGGAISVFTNVASFKANSDGRILRFKYSPDDPIFYWWGKEIPHE